MRKKILSIVLTSMVAIVTLVGCGNAAITNVTDETKAVDTEVSIRN